MNLLWYLRVIIFYLAIAATTISLFPILLVIHTLNLSYDYRYFMAKLYSQIFIWFGKIICGLRYQVLGLEKLPKGPAVFMANHQSFWENMFLQLIVPKHSWVIKKELLNIPVFGWGLKMVNPIAVDRKDNMSVNQIVKGGVEKLQQGLWLVIFPESTRLRPHEHRKFKPSGIKLAMEAKVPVVLMAHNAGLYWPKNIWIQKPGLITVEILSVLQPEDLENADVRQITSQVEEKINYSKNLLANGKLVV
jgi:1-acyl-sn-glycerol-3-phosphate acyltransferase